MTTDDLTQWEHVDGEEEGAKDRALWHTVVDWGRVRAGSVYCNELFSVRQIGVEPGQSSTSESNVGGKAGQKNGVGDCVEGSSKVKQDQNADAARIRSP